MRTNRDIDSRMREHRVCWRLLRWPDPSACILEGIFHNNEADSQAQWFPVDVRLPASGVRCWFKAFA